MQFNCAYTELVSISKLVPNPKNANKHSAEQIERLAKIIDFQGQRSPVVVSKRSGFITKGHGRLMAMQKLGWENVAVDYQDYISEAQEYADIIADNEIARWAELDREMMYEDLKDLDLGDMDLLGLEEFEVEIEELPRVIDGDIEFAKELDEKNNYLVLYFDKKEDFKVACEKLGVKSEQYNPSASGNENMNRTGIGRVIDGAVLIDRL